MAVVDYCTIYNEIVSETRGNIDSDYVPDPLGSTAKLVASGNAITDTFAWWPYGEQRSHSGSNPTPFGFVGTFGYCADPWGGVYIRAREYKTALGAFYTTARFVEVRQGEHVYAYAVSNPTTYTDPSGLCPPNLALICRLNCRARMSTFWRHWEWHCTVDAKITCNMWGLPMYVTYSNYQCTCLGVIPKSIPIKKPPCDLTCQVLCGIIAIGLPLPPPYDTIDFGPGNCEAGCQSALKAVGLCA